MNKQEFKAHIDNVSRIYEDAKLAVYSGYEEAAIKNIMELRNIACGAFQTILNQSAIQEQPLPLPWANPTSAGPIPMQNIKDNTISFELSPSHEEAIASSEYDHLCRISARCGESPYQMFKATSKLFIGLFKEGASWGYNQAVGAGIINQATKPDNK